MTSLIRRQLTSAAAKTIPVWDGDSGARPNAWTLAKVTARTHSATRATESARPGRTDQNHRRTDLRLAERGRIIHAVAGHAHDMVVLLQAADEQVLVVWVVGTRTLCAS
jgi:hypothetical protein